jgi:hypothetical protein
MNEETATKLLQEELLHCKGRGVVATYANSVTSSSKLRHVGLG